MIWIALFLAFIIGASVGTIKRSFKKGVLAGIIVLISGIIISFLIVYSGLLGG